MVCKTEQPRRGQGSSSQGSSGTSDTFKYVFERHDLEQAAFVSGRQARQQSDGSGHVADQTRGVVIFKTQQTKQRPSRDGIDITA